MKVEMAAIACKLTDRAYFRGVVKNCEQDQLLGVLGKYVPNCAGLFFLRFEPEFYIR